MIPMLAEASDTLVSGNWIIAVIGAIAAGIAHVVGRKVGRNEGENSRDVLIKKPVPTIQTREEPHWATKPELAEHVERTEQHFRDVWTAIESGRETSRVSLGKIHQRIDSQATATAAVQASVEEIRGLVGRLLDLALNRKSPNA